MISRASIGGDALVDANKRRCPEPVIRGKLIDEPLRLVNRGHTLDNLTQTRDIVAATPL